MAGFVEDAEFVVSCWRMPPEFFALVSNADELAVGEPPATIACTASGFQSDTLRGLSDVQKYLGAGDGTDNAEAIASGKDVF